MNCSKARTNRMHDKVFVQQTLKTASTDEEIAFKQKEKDTAAYTRTGIDMGIDIPGAIWFGQLPRIDSLQRSGLEFEKHVCRGNYFAGAIGSLC